MKNKFYEFSNFRLIVPEASGNCKTERVVLNIFILYFMALEMSIVKALHIPSEHKYILYKGIKMKLTKKKKRSSLAQKLAINVNKYPQKTHSTCPAAHRDSNEFLAKFAPTQTPTNLDGRWTHPWPMDVPPTTRAHCRR